MAPIGDSSYFKTPAAAGVLHARRRCTSHKMRNGQNNGNKQHNMNKPAEQVDCKSYNPKNKYNKGKYAKHDYFLKPV